MPWETGYGRETSGIVAPKHRGARKEVNTFGIAMGMRALKKLVSKCSQIKREKRYVI